MTRPQIKRMCLTLAVLASLCTFRSQAQSAAILHAQAESESDQEKQVMLLCKAAEAAPGNAEYRRDCDASKAALLNQDKVFLQKAKAFEAAGQKIQAQRNAKYVSSLDPDLHHQAEQLLAKVSGSDAGTTASGTGSTTVQGPNQSALLAQAQAAFDTGKLQEAKNGAQAITDPNLKPSAARILNDIDRYTGYVTAGKDAEGAKKYADAERSYQAAIQLNAHVSSDDLAARAQRMHQAASAVAGNSNTIPNVYPGGTIKPLSNSPEERIKNLLKDSALAMSRNDLDTAGRAFQEVLKLNPSNNDAKRGLSDITAALNKDPEKLEKTLREAIVAFYASKFVDAELRFNRYLGADSARKKGAAYFYLGATEATLAMLDESANRESRTKQAQEDFKQARIAKYEPVESYISPRVLEVWKSSGM